ncbi:MAG TPA: hypothetical protein VGK17_01400 [Propionicimonas sp.]
MTFDLSRALQDAAEGGVAGRMSIPPGRVVTRIRRRRAVRTTTNGAVGVAAAGALAIAGWQLGGSPTSGWGHDAATPDRTLVTGASCGGPVEPASGVVSPSAGAEGLPVPATAGESARLTLASVSSPVEGGGVLAVDVTLTYTWPADPPGDLALIGDVQLIIAKDGVVVGRTAENPSGFVSLLTVRRGSGADPATTIRSREINLVQCADGIGLPAGDYELYAAQALRAAAGTAGEGTGGSTDAGTGGAPTVLVTAGPWPLTVTEPGPDGAASPIPTEPASTFPPGPWVDVPLGSVPTEVPIGWDRTFGARSKAGTLMVDGETDKDGYQRLADALVGAGFALVEESIDPRSNESRGIFESDRYRVILDVSNPTGGGFMGSYEIRERTGG